MGKKTMSYDKRNYELRVGEIIGQKYMDKLNLSHVLLIMGR